LTLAEFAYNNTIHASTRQTPFYANYRYHLKFDLFNISQMDNPTAKDLALRLSEFQDTMKLHLQEAQKRYKLFAKVLCKELPPFQVGERFGSSDTTSRLLDHVTN